MVSDLNIFVFKLSKIAKHIKNVFFVVGDFAYKTRWKQPFPMDSRPLVKRRIANFGIFLDVFEFLYFG